MASEAQARAGSLLLDPGWPPDDTEESIADCDLHKRTILNIRLGINEVARLEAAPGAEVPWQATHQLPLLGCVRPDGSAYRIMPDMFVFPHPIDPLYEPFTLFGDGAPVLIVEVLSESTHDADLDLMRGKGYSYAQAGVREYLTLDPTGQWLSEGGRGWRLVEGVYQPWLLDAAGCWRCESIAVSIGLEGAVARVYTHAGVPIPHEGQIMAELARKDAEVAWRDAELARKQAEYATELARRDAEIARMEAEHAELLRQLDELHGGR
jgi:hypothetical protein